MLEGFSLGSYLLLVDYTGRLFRETLTQAPSLADARCAPELQRLSFSSHLRVQLHGQHVDGHSTRRWLRRPTLGGPARGAGYGNHSGFERDGRPIWWRITPTRQPLGIRPGPTSRSPRSPLNDPQRAGVMPRQASKPPSARISPKFARRLARQAPNAVARAIVLLETGPTPARGISASAGHIGRSGAGRSGQPRPSRLACG